MRKCEISEQLKCGFDNAYKAGQRACNQDLLEALQEMLHSAPVPHGITTDEQRERWHKALVNACEAIEASAPAGG